MHRAAWAYQIGCFMISMGEIEVMCNDGLRTAVGLPAEPKWPRWPLKDRIEKILERRPADATGQALSQHLDKVLNLLSLRHTLAHGTYAFAPGHSSEIPNFVFWRHGSESPVTATQMINAVQELAAASDGIAECLGIWDSSPSRAGQ